LAGFGSPPFSTISRARHTLLSKGGPRPLRSRDNPLEPLQGLPARELRSCQLGSYLFLVVVNMLGTIATRGFWTGFEHPKDPGGPPFLLFFTPDIMRRYITHCYMSLQCMCGALSRKHTNLVIPDFMSTHLQLHCDGRHKHNMLIGTKSDGTFYTAVAAHYPSGLCEEFAQVIVASSVQYRDTEALPLTPHVQWEWQTSCADLSASYLGSGLSEPLSASHYRFQN
jgi:hypothetical protein